MNDISPREVSELHARITQELNKVIVALVRVFIANGNRGDRKKARLKHLLETWTVDQYLAETEKLLGWQLRRAMWAQLRNCSSFDKQIRTPVSRFLSHSMAIASVERFGFALMKAASTAAGVTLSDSCRSVYSGGIFTIARALRTVSK